MVASIWGRFDGTTVFITQPIRRNMERGPSGRFCGNFLFDETTPCRRSTSLHAHITQCGKRSSPLHDVPFGYVTSQYLLSTICFEDGRSVWVKSGASSVELKKRIRATSVDANNECLVLDRSSLQKSDPMFRPFLRPTSNEDEQFSTVSDSRPKDLRKPQVIADERCDFHAIPLEYLMA